MEINGEVKEFDVNGRGIDLDSDGSGHTLSLWLYTADTQTQEDSYAIIIKLPYKKTGTNIIETFNYLHFQDGSFQDIDFVQEAFQNTVTVNTNSCFSATFSGHTVVDGNFQYSRTDDDGKCAFKLEREGDWFFHATHMIASSNQKDTDWESFWTTFSFGLVETE